MTQTLASAVHAETVIKKSRFLAWVEPVASKAEAQARLADFQQRYPDARHICYAFCAGGDSGMSDDGEPSGTAGKPIFNVLGHKRLDNVLAVVVRYFGGIKLGAGGLVRAYGGAVSQALESADYVRLETQQVVQLTFPFALESDVRRLLERFGFEPDQVDYGDGVAMTVQLPASRADEFSAALTALAPAEPALRIRPAD